ncbi:von Willebrand factor type A domain-containing protein [Hymenobacter sp. M29]|uniref:von Willebrand factor type A domain-containing protein n=1 Tax=Hymenobacter mellowenesis TaxID=3063995 RepID=A0ABT9AH00_9BACT|nr:von Willebrand factor type A domain-containing protein [Hymenobacter sp. M29]MDO7848838.1 von Willebrand factor type A domain-containing protein [Hymenobacter sp. M29]
MRNLLLLPLLLSLLAPLSPALAQKKAKSPAPTAAPEPADTIRHRTLTGIVLDARTKQGLPGVTVLIKGTQQGAATEHDGRYSLWVLNAASATLVFTALGYKKVERQVGGARVINVALFSEIKQLNEVSVAAYGIENKAERSAAPAAASKRKMKMAQDAADVAYTARMWPNSAPAMPIMPAQPEAGAGDTYAHTPENKFFEVKKDPLSTFALDVDNASYSNVRRFLNEGQLPPRDAVRVEEMLNYFRYDYPAPAATSPDPVRISTELAVCPWNPAHQLARIGIQAKKIETAKLPPANLVFLVDVSGSMYGADRLPLVRAGLKLLVKQLRPQDHVALVVYAGAAGLVLPPTSGSQPQVILDAIDRLQAGGSTAGGAGLRLAYSTARQSFNKEGNNRVILATDGDFNVGESSDAAMEQLIVEQRESGVFLTVLGCGRGNLRDSRMETLADKGNGNYAYLDNLDEAGRVLVAQFGGTLFTVAKDVKLQVEFNPARVANYRLVGYENRMLEAEDFNNDRKDAGELGAGHTVTALYEIVPVGASQPLVDDLKYQPTKTTTATLQQFITNDVLTVKLRYKEPQGSTSKLLSQALTGTPASIEKATPDFRFAAAVAQFGMLLRQSEQRGTATWAATEQLANNARGTDADGYRAELVRLVRLAEGLSGSGAVGKR